MEIMNILERWRCPRPKPSLGPMQHAAELAKGSLASQDNIAQKTLGWGYLWDDLNVLLLRFIVNVSTIRLLGTVTLSHCQLLSVLKIGLAQYCFGRSL